MSCLVVTGTDTGVGKTVVTAALACHVRVAGGDVTVCKPVQTGSDGGVAGGADGDDDLAEVARLSGVADLVSGWRYPEPFAPVAAAQRAGLALPTRGELVDLVTANDLPGKLVLVEGAGGLLVDIGMDDGLGVTLRDVATDLQAAVLVVVRAGLGTLNHALLTVEALAAKDVPCAGLVIGAWPVHPGPVESSNLEALGRIAPIRAVLPAGLGRVTPEEFAEVSAEAFSAYWVQSL